MTSTAPVTTSPAATLEGWLPEDAEQVDTADFYARLAERGFQYGPAFQGLRSAWCRGQDVYAEIELDEAVASSAGSFLLHPALLDAALHAALVPGLGTGGGTVLPFAWRGVRVQAAGQRSLRVRISPDGANAVSLSAVDAGGRPVASVRSLAVRPVTAEQLGSAGRNGRLLRLEWKRFPLPASDRTDRPVWAFLGADPEGVAEALRAGDAQVETHRSLGSLDRALRAGGRPPEAVVVSCVGESDTPEGVRAATQRALILLQEWINDVRLLDCRLVLLTHGAVATSAGQGVR